MQQIEGPVGGLSPFSDLPWSCSLALLERYFSDWGHIEYTCFLAGRGVSSPGKSVQQLWKKPGG